MIKNRLLGGILLFRTEVADHSDALGAKQEYCARVRAFGNPRHAGNCFEWMSPRSEVDDLIVPADDASWLLRQLCYSKQVAGITQGFYRLRDCVRGAHDLRRLRFLQVQQGAARTVTEPDLLERVAD